MTITFDEQAKTFTLQTKNSTYQMQISFWDTLAHIYYGKKTEGCLDYLINPADRGFSGNPLENGSDRTRSIDTLPQEYPTHGVGDYHQSCLQVINADGSNAVSLRYKSHKIYHGKPALPGLPHVYAENENQAETLEITLFDKWTNMEVTLMYNVFPEFDAITRSAVIKNGGSQPVFLEKALSTCIDYWDNKLEFISFYGRHNKERNMERTPVRHGRIVIDSVRGASSFQQTPFSIICDPKTDETTGDAYGFSFVYSGSHVTEVEVDQFSKARVEVGINPTTFRWKLEAGEEFQTPEVVHIFSQNGFGQMSRNYHRLYRNNLCRGKWKNARRPILINNWEATYFNFNEEKLFQIADAASKLGIEMLVMDDGWFGKRDDDNSGLGDWILNEKKIKGGLGELCKRINSIGMKLGIWVEPEMISEDSDLYRQHPDWAIQIAGRPAMRSRNQLVLDMTRKDVRDYILDRISDVLKPTNIEYVKWDFNRHICDAWSHKLPAERMGEFHHRYMLGTYELFNQFNERFPNILLESCSGGGGRYDPGMLYYSPQIWCSDDTDSYERLSIQYGTSFVYPVSSTGSHVSAVPNHQTGRTAPLKTRGIVAMSGTFGYELDISKMTPEEMEEVKGQVETFKKHYEVIQRGDYYRLTNPYENDYYSGWLFVNAEKTQALLNVIQIRAQPNPLFFRVILQGLNPEKKYKINDREFSGSALMSAGYVLPVTGGDLVGYQIDVNAV